MPVPVLSCALAHFLHALLRPDGRFAYEVKIDLGESKGGINVGPASSEYGPGHLDRSGETEGGCRLFPNSEAFLCDLICWVGSSQ